MILNIPNGYVVVGPVCFVLGMIVLLFWQYYVVKIEKREKKKE